jgi:hypothetical protein
MRRQVMWIRHLPQVSRKTEAGGPLWVCHVAKMVREMISSYPWIIKFLSFTPFLILVVLSLVLVKLQILY